MRTALTAMFGTSVPIVSAPMARAAGAELAMAVSRAGGLGLIGGGYGDAAWCRAEMAAADPGAVGIGFIGWSVPEAVLEEALEWRPRALMLSFDDPARLSGPVKDAGVPLIWQVQTTAQARSALEAGADVLVAQGAEAGGHGAARGTMALVPEVVDLAGEVPVLAAGGIADGRGLAAALMLGAAGALVGSRFWASAEALVPDGLVTAALKANGDATVRGSVPDAARGLRWPSPYTVRTLRNGLVDRWEGREEALRADPAAQAAWAEAMAKGEPDGGSAIVGEATGLISDRPPAGEIVARMATEAQDCLARGARMGGTA